MDHNKNYPNTADALLQKLKQTMEQNDSDKESIAAEEAATKNAHGTRYKFRVMKRSEYMEKKRIADAFAAAADEADISDDDLEALLRNYLKKTPPIDPVVEALPAEEPAAADPIIDLDKPLSREESPFFEDIPIETLAAAEDTADEEVVADAISDDELDALLDLIADEDPAAPVSEAADEASEEDVLSAPAAEDDENGITDPDIAALLASIPEDGDALSAEEEDVTDGIPAAEAAEQTPADEGAVSDDDLAALLALIDAEEDPAPAKLDEAAIEDDSEALAVTAEETAVPVITETSADAISDAELEAMLAMIEGETAPEAQDAAASEEEGSDPEKEVPGSTDALDDTAFDDSLFDELTALAEEEADGEPFTAPAEETEENDAVITDTAADDNDDAALTAPAEPDTMQDADDADEAGEFDQTDLDLMIAFGMEDQIETAVGGERAKKYKKAIGDRSDDHFNKMHSGDRPDTVQDKHAEYVSPAQNREIFAEYKKKYSGMLFRFLGALFFFVLLFFFENNRLLGITMPSVFDREQYPLVYTLFDLQLVALSGAMVWKGIRTGIRAIFRGRPVPESITGFLFLACIVYTVIIASLCPMHGLQLYNFPIGLAVLFELCYEFMNLRREIMSFKIVSSKKLKYAVDAIAPKDGEAERKMFAEYISDDPALFRIKRTAFVESFFARTETYPRTQRILRAILPAVLLMVLAFFAAKFILSGSVYEAVTVAYITMLLTLPSCAFIMFSYPMYRASGFAYEKDSAMIGEASLGEYADASVVSFDDKEVFPARGVRVRNVKVYGENRIDHVIYAAASVFHVVGGPLAEVFETATGELGYAENVKLTRLDRDGIEARVDGGTVLIGRAPFINRYGYAVSLNESEKSMEETGDASILYIAYDNNVTAKLYIQYSVEPDFEIVLKQLYRQGVCVGIKTSDPNIDDHLLSCKIKMSKYPVKIIKCAEPKETAIIVDRLSSGIVSKSSAKALLQTLAICDRVLSASRTNNVLGIVSILLGMAAMAFCIISGMAITLAPLWIALYQLFWIVPVIAISRYYI